MKTSALVLLVLLAGPAFGQESSSPSPSPSRPGPTIPGTASIDPTENVKALSEAANKRQDDLRVDAKELFDVKIKAAETLNDLRYSSLKDNIALRAEYEEKLRKGEASRLDAIRLVDTTNLSVDRERAAATAQALQKKGDDSALVLSAAVVKSADDVRNIVKTTADEQARNLATQLGGIQSQFTDIGKRLTLLEQTGAEGLGKQKYQDPAQAALIAAVQKLNEKSDTTAGAGVGRGEIIGYIGGFMMFLLMLAGVLVAFLNKKPQRR